MKTLTIKDESATGKVLHELLLQFESEYISVKELIETRVKEEISRSEKDVKNYKKGLIEPTDLESRLNNKLNRKIDSEKQVYVALDAFQKNDFFILVDNEQVETLDQKFLVEPTTVVSFVKLTPLVGG